LFLTTLLSPVISGMVHSSTVPGHPVQSYGCAGTAEEASNQDICQDGPYVSAKKYGGRRRARVLITSIGALAACIAFCGFLNEVMNAEGVSRNVNVLEESGDPEKQPTPEDTKFCSGFEGWLQTDCLKSRVEDRNTVKIWTDDQVRALSLSS
jgi:hypothetical protein